MYHDEMGWLLAASDDEISQFQAEQNVVGVGSQRQVQANCGEISGEKGRAFLEGNSFLAPARLPFEILLLLGHSRVHQA